MEEERTSSKEKQNFSNEAVHADKMARQKNERIVGKHIFPAILIFYSAVLLMLLLCGCVFLYPKIESLTADQTHIRKGESVSLQWRVSPSVDRLSLSGDIDRNIDRKAAGFTVSPAQSTTYRLTVENWFSRLLQRQIQKEITIQVISELPTIDLLKADLSTSNGEESALLRWRVGDQADQAILSIGNEKSTLSRTQFIGEQSISLHEGTYVALQAKNGSGKMIRSLFLQPNPKKPVLKKFILWVKPETGSASVFSQKFSELIPDEATAAGFRLIEYQPERQLQTGEQVWVEWQVEGVSTIMLEPLSETPVDSTGSQVFSLTRSVNFVLTIQHETGNQLFWLPVLIGDAKKETPPEIEFFKANPVEVQGTGDVILSWSVAGKWTRIQLMASDASVRSNSPIFSTPAAVPGKFYSSEDLSIQSRGILITEALYPAGFLTMHVSKETSFILKAWNGVYSDSANVDIRMKPSESEPENIQLKIRTILPASSVYTTGETVAIYTEFSGLSASAYDPTGTIRVSDGIADCTIRLPENSCSLTFVDSGTKEISARYLGDTRYHPVTAKKGPINVLEKSSPALEISGLFPNHAVYTAGDSVDVHVLVSEVRSPDYPLEGKIKVSDGTTACLIAPNTAFQCPLLLIDPDASQITASYAGDTFYAPAESDPYPIEVTEHAGVPTTTRISGVLPDQEPYEIGEELEVYVNVVPQESRSESLSGTINVTDGNSSCTIKPGGENHCSLKLISSLSTAITAAYSGDSNYAPSASDPYPIEVAQHAGVPTTTIISGVLPDQETYEIGDELEVYVNVVPQESRSESLSGTITVTDGYSSCTIKPGGENHCSLKLISSLSTAITAAYSGDATYALSTSDAFPIQITSHKGIPTTTTISGVFPDQETYEIGEELEVYVNVIPQESRAESMSGTIIVTDGYSSCTIKPGGENHCSLKLISSLSIAITAAYSGDSNYAPSTSDPFPIQVGVHAGVPTTTIISGVLPDQETFEIGEELEVYVNVVPQENRSESLSGTITVTDGYSSCTIQPKEDNFCTLKLISSLATEIIAVFSGDEIFAASQSEPFPVTISMVNISASLQPMKFIDCDMYIADPDHRIMSQTDPSLSPAVRYFTLDSSFLAGSGFFVQVTLNAKSGQFGADPGTVAGSLCSQTNPDYCISSSMGTVARDAWNFTQATAVIEFPIIHYSGNFKLKISYSGDGILFGENSAGFEVRGFQKAFLMLIPAEVTNPADFSTPSIRWPNITASELRGTDYFFNAYYLMGGKTDCPIKLDADTFPKPAGFHIKVQVADSVFGSNQTDNAWQSLLTSNGYESEVIARLQPNFMDWLPAACTWQNNSNSWQIRCDEVGIMEPSTLTYSADEQDPNYQVFDSEDMDRDSDLRIQAEIGKYLSFLDVGHLTQPLTADIVYWINYRKGTVFDKFVGKYCSDIINPTGTRTVSYYLLDAHGEPASQVINLTPFVLSRSQMDPVSPYRTPSIEAPIAISASGGIAPLSVLLPYYGYTADGQIIDLNNKARIKNYGCSVSGENSILITSFSGTLSDGVDCNDGTGIKVNVSSSFCQLSFAASADGLPVIASFSGNDSVVGSQKEITLDVNPPASGTRLMMMPDLHIETATAPDPTYEATTVPDPIVETAVVPQPVTLLPSLVNTASDSPAYTLFTGDEYLLKLTASVPLTADAFLSANLPPILSAALLDLEKSTCQNFFNTDFSRLIIPGSEFSSEHLNTFTCSIVFSSETIQSGLQTMNFDLQSSSEGAAPFQMTPFSWSGLPAVVSRHSLTYLAEIRDNAGNLLCSSMYPACGSMYAGDVYQLSVQIPAVSDEITANLIRQLPDHEELGQAVITWPEDWAESIRISHVLQNQNGIEGLCSIDASNQTVLPVFHETGTASGRIACLFVPGQILPGFAGALQFSIGSSRFQFQDAQLFFPGIVEKRVVTLSSSLSLQMNPEENGPVTEEISSNQVNRLYRTIHPSPGQMAFTGGIAAYTLSGSISGISQGNDPLPSDQILVRWNLLDILFAAGELPPCFSPAGDGWFQLGILSAGGDGTWRSSCPLQFPSSIAENTAGGILSMRLQSVLFEDSIEISIAEHPFHREEVHAVVSVPEQLKLSTDYSLEVNLNPASAPLSEYARSLLRYDPSLLITPVWIHQSVLACSDSNLLNESFRTSCAFRFDSIPEINTESDISLAISSAIPSDLLSFVLESASTAERQDVFSMPPVSRINLTLHTKLFHLDTEMQIPANNEDVFLIQDPYTLQILAEFPDTADQVPPVTMQNTVVRINWPLLASPALSGSCMDPAGSVSLPFQFNDSSQQWIAECNFSLIQGDLPLTEAEKVMSVILDDPDFETVMLPQGQPFLMPGQIQKKQPMLSFSPIYRTGNSNELLDTQIPVGSEAAIDCYFEGDPAAYNPDGLVVQTNSGEMLDCLNNGTTKTCRIPASCTDGAPFPDTTPYPEKCSAEMTIHAIYPGDFVHQSAEISSPGLTIVRNTLDIITPPDDQFAKDFLHHIWQSAEDGQSWNIVSISAGDWGLDTFLIRDVRSTSSGIQYRSYPIQADFQCSNPAIAPDPSLFSLEITFKKSNFGMISEEIISLKPVSIDLSGHHLSFEMNFGENAATEDGSVISEKMAQIMSIEKISIRYAGDPFIVATEVPFQSENLAYPIKVVSMIEQQLWQDSGQIGFGDAAGAEAGGIQFRLFCSQQFQPLNCFAEPPDPELSEQNGCWGTVNLPQESNPIIFTSDLYVPRCYLLGIKQLDAHDQIWLSDSYNEGL